jgi:hypothetical protein
MKTQDLRVSSANATQAGKSLGIIPGLDNEHLGNRLLQVLNDFSIVKWWRRRSEISRVLLYSSSHKLRWAHTQNA